MIDKRVAIITGAARGIGYGIAEKLTQDDIAVVIFDIIERDQVEESIQNLKDTGVPVFYVQGDLTNSNDRKKLCQKTMEKFGRIDILVNNAGVAPRERNDILEMSEDSFDFVVGINLKGTLFLTQEVANVMIEKSNDRGAINPLIVNIGSLSSYTSSPNRGEYCISKAGVSMLTKLFADRLAEDGINVYEVRPGIIYTDMTKVVKDKYDKLIDEGLTPIKRWGYPEDIANAVSVFCSGMLNFSTGEVINVDGGFHLKRL